MKICFFQGRMYQSPKETKTSNGKEVYLFSLGINNSYKDNKGELVKRPMTFINFSSVDKKHFEELSKAKIKEDIISVVARLDIVDIEENGTRTTKYYFNALDVSVNNKDLYNQVISLFYNKDKNKSSKSKETNNENNDNVWHPDEYMLRKKTDDLPF